MPPVLPPPPLRVDGREGSAGCSALPSEEYDDKGDPMPSCCVVSAEEDEEEEDDDVLLLLS